MTTNDINREVFLQEGGSAEQYEAWRRTRSCGPGGTLIVERWEAEQAGYWLNMRLEDLNGVAWVG